eukprot:ANDGO_01161.mRNA.1 hypothetical protein
MLRNAGILRRLLLVENLFFFLFFSTIFNTLVSHVKGETTPKLVDSVLFIGVDGLPALSVDNPNPIIGDQYPVPNFQLLMNEGVYAYCSRTSAPTVSSPNWAAMLTGISPTVSGFVSNPASEVQPASFRNQGSTLFNRVHSGLPNHTMSAFYTWCDIRRWLSFNLNETNVIHDLDWMTLLCTQNDNSTFHEVRGFLENMDPLLTAGTVPGYLTFVQFDEVDATGHEDEWFSDEFNRYVQVIDGYVGQLVDVFNRSMNAANKTRVVILTSDHGGIDTNHDDPTSTRVLNVPYVMWSNNASLFPRNFTLSEPIVYNQDAYSTILRLFGLYDDDVDRYVYTSRPLDSAILPLQNLNATKANYTRIYEMYNLKVNNSNGDRRFCYEY